MTTEWRELKTLQDLAAAQAAGDEIEVRVMGSNFEMWHGYAWHYDYAYRARPKDPYAELKAAANDPTKQIRYGGNWYDSSITTWMWNAHPSEYEIRDKPKTKTIKLKAWLIGEQLAWRNAATKSSSSWKRVPSEDMEIEVEE